MRYGMIATFVWPLLLIGTVAGATTPAQHCRSGKNVLAGKYALCRQKAEAKLATTGDTVRYDAATAKCAVKFDLKWPAVEQKAAGACPSIDDHDPIKAFIDAHTSDIAGELAGGTLPDCAGALATCNANLASCQAAQSGDLYKTGQSLCYDASHNPTPCGGTGQDGELQLGLAHTYVDNGDGTVTDTGTGLMWEKLGADGGIHDRAPNYYWPEAFSIKIATLNSTGFAGHSDWRVPNVNELQSIADYGKANPAINAVFNTACVAGCNHTTCSCTHALPTWSSTTAFVQPSTAWYVNFHDGTATVYFKNNKYVVRAVRTAS